MGIVTLNYAQVGAGPHLLIIHGLFGSSRNWQSLSKQFASDFTVISVDLRNHGDSPHVDEMNFEAMALDVLELLDQLQIEQVSVLGHSMGGKVAMKLCQLRPARIKQLVIADIAPITYRHDYDELIDAVLSLDLSSISNRKQADAALVEGIPDQRVRMFVLQSLGTSSHGLYWKLNWAVIKKCMDEIIGFEDISNWMIDTPALFIYGGQSNYINTEYRQLIEQHFKHCQFSSIDNAGHWLHAEQPQVFYHQVKAFLTLSD